jgi:hypothetical protein
LGFESVLLVGFDSRQLHAIAHTPAEAHMDAQVPRAVCRQCKRPTQPLHPHGELVPLELEDCHVASLSLPAVRRPTVTPARVSARNEDFGESP